MQETVDGLQSSKTTREGSTLSETPGSGQWNRLPWRTRGQGTAERGGQCGTLQKWGPGDG